MRLLYITLLLCALSITVHSTADNEKVFGEVLRYLEENLLDTCNKPSEDSKRVQCVQRKLEAIKHFSSLSFFFIEKCNCFKCVETNIQRAAFDFYMMATVVEPCEWFEHDNADKDEQLYKCIVDKVGKMDLSNIGLTLDKVNPTMELESMKQHFEDCKAKGNKGKDLVTCVENKYDTERPKLSHDECQSNEDRTIKLYNSLRALLTRYPN